MEVLVSDRGPQLSRRGVPDSGRGDSGVLTDAQQLLDDRAGLDGLAPHCRRTPMAVKREPIEYADAGAEVRAVYDDIMATRKTDWVNNFWKVLAHDPPTLRRIWTNIKEVMGPGTLPPLVKELLYVAVSASNGCHYCIASHGAAARKQGMTEAQFSELLAIVGLANETNRLVTALGVAIDPAFL
jgi:AhpD family alkylhydroperoxidase